LYIAEQTKDISSFWETVLNKVLYFCDFNYYEWTDSLITWTIYKKLPFWPVPDGITNVLGEMQRDGLIALQNTTFHWYEQQKIIPLKETNLSFLDEIDKIAKSHEFAFPDTPTPKVVIDDALNKYKYFNAKQISEWSHLDKPWKCAKNIWEELEPWLTHYRSESFITNHHGL
jgi:hypothetical protein